MKISTKLYGMAVISLIGLATMLWTLYVQMGVVEERVVDATENSLPSVIVAGDARAQYLEARRQPILHIAYQDLASKKEAQAALEDNVKNLIKDLDNYRNTLVSNEEDRANTDAALQP